MCVKQTCSRTIQTSSAYHFVRGAHHRRCAREGLTGFMMPYAQGKLQAHWPGYSAIH
jgi:urease beta subunit